MKQVRVVKSITYLYDADELVNKDMITGDHLNDNELMELATEQAQKDFDRDIEEGNQMDFADNTEIEAN